MFAHIKPRLLTALAALLVAPLAPAQTPANLHDCQAYTREMHAQWLNDEKQLIACQVLQKYGLSASEPRYIGDRQIAEHCQSEQPRLKKMLQPLIP